MPYRPDLIATDPAGHPVAIIETKSLRLRSRQPVDECLEQLANYGDAAGARYFALALPDRLFVAERAESPASSSPRLIAEFDGALLWGPYFEQAGINAEEVRPRAFEMIVEQFFEDLASESGPATERASNDLATSAPGFTSALRGATVTAEARV